MSAAESHLEKLDRVQRSVSSSCGFETESLGSRREAAVMSMLCKMLDGKPRGDLDLFTPQLGEPLTLSKKRTRGDFQEGIQLKSLAWVSTLVPLVSQVYIYTSQAFLNATTCYEMCYP
jgi:hypothetical protein